MINKCKISSVLLVVVEWKKPNQTIQTLKAMGVCASKTNEKPRASGKGGRGGGGAAESFRRPSSVMVMDMAGGGIKEYKQPVPARVVVSENPDCYLCNSESMCVGTCMPRVPDEEVLLPGRIYFLVPLSHSHHQLSLPLLCDLAVKASSVLDNANPSTSTTTSTSCEQGTEPMFIFNALNFDPSFCFHRP